MYIVATSKKYKYYLWILWENEKEMNKNIWEKNV